MIRECNKCNQAKDIYSFEEQQGKNGKIYFRRTCIKCKNKYDYSVIKSCHDKYEKHKAKNRRQRFDPKKRPRYILQDSLSYDKKHNLSNNLDKEFISILIKDGCSYCNDSNARIGIDRIDNSIGHIKTNVVAACTTCNFIRRGMPYEAWLVLVPGIKKIKEEGLLGDWHSGINMHKVGN